MNGNREGCRIEQRRLSDPDSDLTRSIAVKVTNHLSWPENLPVLALKVLCPRKSLSPSKLGLLFTLHQLNGKLGSKGCPVEESCLGWKWPGPCITTLLSHWLGPPKTSVTSVTIWFSHWAGTAQEEHDHHLKVEVDPEGADSWRLSVNHSPCSFSSREV